MNEWKRLLGFRSTRDSSEDPSAVVAVAVADAAFWWDEWWILRVCFFGGGVGVAEVERNARWRMGRDREGRLVPAARRQRVHIDFDAIVDVLHQCIHQPSTLQ